MKDDESIPVSTPTTHSKNSTSDATIFGRGRYKFWALAAILLLAFWSMFTGTVTLRWSAGNLNALSDYFNLPLSDDLDVIEMEEREKLVKHMLDVYTNTPRIRLPKFWQEAFEAAYEELTSDLADIREAAISEISKMSLRFVNMEPPSLHSLAVRESSKKQAEDKPRIAKGRKL